MVVFVDLEEDGEEPCLLGRHLQPTTHQHQKHPSVQLSRSMEQAGGATTEEHNQQEELYTDGASKYVGLFASALACYPVSLALASCLDLTDLFSLSSTDRRIHAALTQFAHQLRANSLRCINDQTALPSNMRIDNETVGAIFQEAVNAEAGSNNVAVAVPAFPLPFRSEGSYFHRGVQSSLGLTGKIRQCARDMVTPCRKCGTTICRNCAIKPPSARCLSERFRRLCKTCLDAPLIDHLQASQDDEEYRDSPPASSASSTHSAQSLSIISRDSDDGYEHQDDRGSFTTPAFLREPCTCASRGVFLCQPCGQGLHAADTTYQRVWTWRSRYSTHIGGGLGTGLGLGNQGQKCARGESCLEKGAAGVCWVEIECSDVRPHGHGRYNSMLSSRSGTPMDRDVDTDHTPSKPGYLSQEIEGIGGVVKKKVKKRVKVGATVYEYDDERASGKYLAREASGSQRGYCGWCSRVCLDTTDEAEIGGLLSPRV